jgi:hypothetical protein
VLFKTHEDAVKSLGKDRATIGSRYVQIFPLSEDIPIEDQVFGVRSFVTNTTRTPTADAQHVDQAVLRLCGVPFKASEEDIKQFFGSISIAPNGIWIVKNSRGQANGIVFVILASTADMPEALKLHKRYIGSRYVEVLKSSATEMKNYKAPE